LEKTSKIIKSNQPPNTTKPAKPYPKVTAFSHHRIFRILVIQEMRHLMS